MLDFASWAGSVGIAEQRALNEGKCIGRRASRVRHPPPCLGPAPVVGGRVAAVRGAWPPQAWTLERKLLRHFGDHRDEAYLPGWDFSVIKKAESRSDGSLACTIDRSSECGYTKYGSHIVIYSDNRPSSHFFHHCRLQLSFRNSPVDASSVNSSYWVPLVASAPSGLRHGYVALQVWLAPCLPPAQRRAARLLERMCAKFLPAVREFIFCKG